MTETTPRKPFSQSAEPLPQVEEADISPEEFERLRQQSEQKRLDEILGNQTALDPWARSPDG